MLEELENQSMEEARVEDKIKENFKVKECNKTPVRDNPYMMIEQEKATSKKRS